jgi:hypothetical protein
MFRKSTNLPAKKTVYFYADFAESTMDNVLAALKDPKTTHLSISFLEKEFMIKNTASYFTKIMDAIYAERSQSLAYVEIISRHELPVYENVKNSLTGQTRLEKHPYKTDYLEIPLYKKEFPALKQEEEAKNTESNTPSVPNSAASSSSRISR